MSNMFEKKYAIDNRDGNWEIPKLINDHSDILEWKGQKSDIAKKISCILRGTPDPVPVFCKKYKTDVCEGHNRICISYSSMDDDQITAYLLVPADLKTGEKRPAVMALHQTTEVGKDEVAGITGNPDYAYGLELVKRGYVVLVPDIFAAGERIPEGKTSYETDFLYERYPDWSAMGKMLYDHIQGVNLLVSLPEVDSNRIGAIGHSLGGHNAFFLAAFDERIKACVSSCGLCSILGDPNVFRWSRTEWFVYFKSLREYFEAGYSPFEFHEVLALIAPRAFFNWSTRQDDIFPHWQGIEPIEKRVKEVFNLYNADDKVKFVMGDGAHCFPREIRDMAYEFFAKWL